MNTLTRKLIAKEFHLHRSLIAGSTIAGVVGLLTAAEGVLRFNIGMLIWLTAIIAFGVMLAMLGVTNERKDGALQFVLSLPLSPGGYMRIKLWGLLLCYLVPWVILSAGAVGLILAMPNLPNGLLPFTVLLCVFMLANFSLVLGSALLTASEGWMTLVIIVTNMNVTLFMFLVGAIPSLGTHMFGGEPVWNATFWTILSIELATLALGLSTPYFLAARRRDFV